jgi:hypothetical protein
MTIRDLVVRHPLAAAVITGAAVGLTAGAMVAPPRAPAADGRETALSLPPASVVVRVTDGEFASVRGAAALGAATTGGVGSVKAPSWKLTGIITRPVPAALIAVDGERRVMQVRIGEPLPDGGVLQAVRGGSLRYARDACTYERTLYTVAEVPVGGTCPAAPAPTASQPPATAPTQVPTT